MRELTTSQAINEALAEELERDPQVFLIGEDIGLHGGAFAVTKGLLQRFGPKRIRNGGRYPRYSPMRPTGSA